jgi:hypothetical protein
VTYRNRKLLDCAHTMPCMATFPHKCEGWRACEPAHSDSHIFGRGHTHTSDDFAFAAMCHTAHMMLDSKEFDRETKFFEWLRAYVATQRWLWEKKLIRVA